MLFENPLLNKIHVDFSRVHAWFYRLLHFNFDIRHTVCKACLHILKPIFFPKIVQIIQIYTKNLPLSYFIIMILFIAFMKKIGAIKKVTKFLI